ncbi:MAG: response regulator [Pseudomonadota bacterium]
MASVLILEDDFELAKAWQQALEASGHTATIARSSQEAIEKVKRNRFDAAVVDLMIDTPPDSEPDSGIHFLRTLRNLEMPMPKLIGVSGYYGSDKGEMAANLLKVYGVHKIVLKPFEPAVLIQLI